MPRLSQRSTPTLVLVAAALLGLLAIWGFYTSDGAAKARERDARLAAAQEGGPTEPAPSLEVETEIARAIPSAEIVELVGRLEPVRSTWVSAEIAGRIVSVPATEHAPITKGAVLVELDSALPRAELIRAEASHRLAKAELERQQRLGKRSVASEAELDSAIAEERRSYAALLEARTRLAHTRIAAPFDGLVNALDLDPGTYVQPGSRIAEVLDLSVLEVTVLVGDRQVGSLTPGADARIRVDVLGDAPFEGRIARVAGAPVDEGSRYPVVVELAVPNGDEARHPRPGMVAQVQFEVGRAAAIRLPARAVLDEFELQYVYVLDAQDRATRVRVSTRPVPFRPDRVEITDGIEDGTRVVVTAVDQLRTGMRVLVR
ncbi:MAG: efflux RND transporter periplasmic adaptor subunit [bacterium]|nr:efflux RND transporter periplasmic adaptor subunit [bacterium]